MHRRKHSDAHLLVGLSEQRGSVFVKADLDFFAEFVGRCFLFWLRR